MSAQVPLIQTIMHDAEEKMKKALDRMRGEFSSLRSGRASPSLLENVKVDFYGASTPLKQVAAIGVPDGRTLEVKPWDVSQLPALEKAIHMSGLGLTPSNDGKLIRITLPTPTEERRRELVKMVKKMTEEFRVSIRNDRREAMEKLKNAEKDKALTQDQLKTSEHALQTMTDTYVRRVDEGLAAKEKEIMEV